MWRCLLLLACLLVVPAWAQTLAPIPALDSPVIDGTGSLTPEQVQQLTQQALALQQRKGSQLQVLMVPSTEPEAIEQYAQRVMDQWKLGRKGVDDGVLLLVAKNDRKVRIQPGYGLEGAIPDAIANRVIQEYLVPHFRAGDFGGGIAAASNVLVKLIDGEALPAPVSSNAAGGNRGRQGPGSGWLFALLAGFIVANVVRGVFSKAPAGIRGLFTGAAAGGATWLVSSLLVMGGIAGVFGLIYGLLSIAPRGSYARHRDWGGWGGGGFGGGGGGFGGGGFGGGGGGWGGGGGMSGGGGASGSW